MARGSPRRDAIFAYLQQEGDASTQEIAAHFGVTTPVVRASIKKSRAAGDGLFRIRAWQRHPKGQPSPIWTAQEGPDAPRLEPLTQRERDVKYRTLNEARHKTTRRKAASWIPFGL